jgi:predicted amidophosphoribosyltransferase
VGYSQHLLEPPWERIGVAAINPQRIYGNWLSGVALDVHTLSSVHLGINEAGHDVFDTKRSELGDLLYRLKYRADRSAAQEIIDTASAYLKPHRSKFDILIPVPPSGARRIQPVITVARGIGAAIGLPVVECVSVTRRAKELKGVMDREKRVELLEGLHAVDATQTRGKNILLFDDLFRSGATMNTITDVLMQHGKAASVRVLTLTRTRSIQ